METIKYKTVQGLLTYNGLQRITFNELKSGQIYSYKKETWIRFEIPMEEKCKCYDLLASVIVSRSRGKYSELMYYYNGKLYGIFDRLWVEIGKEWTLRGTYCAGQDWVYETRYIQRLLRN